MHPTSLVLIHERGLSSSLDGSSLEPPTEKLVIKFQLDQSQLYVLQTVLKRVKSTIKNITKKYFRIFELPGKPRKIF